MFETAIKIRHILELLDDQNPEMQQIVKKAMLENSLGIILSGSQLYQTADAEKRVFIYQALAELRFEMVEHALKQLVEAGLEDIDIEKAALVLAFWNDWEIDIPVLLEELDSLASSVETDMPHSGHPLAFIDHMSHFLFHNAGFHGNTTDYYHPDNSFINRVLETRKGIPITLSVLFMSIANRVNFPVTGVPMPAHFILKFDNGIDEIFFDPFYGGKVYSRDDCLKYLHHAKAENPEEILDGCPNWQVLLRMMRNIHLVYSSYQEEPEKLFEIDKLIKFVERSY